MSWQDLNDNNSFEVHITADLLKPPVIGGAGGGYRMLNGDAFAHTIICEVVRGGEPVDLTGYTCNAYASKGSASGWWTISGTNVVIKDNKILVWFNNSVYNAEGVVRVELRMNRTGGGTYTTVAIVDFVCHKSVTSNGSGQVPATEAWSAAMMDAYLTAMRNVVDSYVAQGGTGTGSGAVEDVFEWVKKWQGLAGTEDAWTTGRSYSQGAYVLYDNCLWRCKVANSGQVPGAGSSYWERESMATVEAKVNDAVNRVDAALGQIGTNVYSVTGKISNIDCSHLKLVKNGKVVVISGYIESTSAIKSTTGMNLCSIPDACLPLTGQAVSWYVFATATSSKLTSQVLVSQTSGTGLTIYPAGFSDNDKVVVINGSWVTAN